MTDVFHEDGQITVRELIEQLSQHDPDLSVFVEEPPGLRWAAAGVAVHDDGFGVVVAALGGEWFARDY